MAEVRSDNPAAGAILQELLDTIAAQGGRVHPQLRLHCEQGSLSVHSSLSPGARELLLLVPEHCLPSANDFEVQVVDGRFRCTPGRPAPSRLQAGIMQQMVALWNELDKAAEHERACPWLALKDVPGLHDRLAAARPGQGPVQRASRSGRPGALAWSTFLDGRCIGQWGERRILVLPVVEIANYHPYAAGYATTAAADSTGAGIGLVNSLPVPDSDEVFVCYGAMDTLDTYLRCSYADEYIDFVQSVPLSLPMPDGGSIEVSSLPLDASRRQPEELPPVARDLAPVFPRFRFRGRGVMELSFLLFPPAPAPRALRRVLELLLGTYAQQRGARFDLAAAVLAAEARALAANREHLDGLRAALRGAPPGVLDTPAARGLQRVVTLQSGLLDAYEQRVAAVPALHHTTGL